MDKKGVNTVGVLISAIISLVFILILVSNVSCDFLGSDIRHDQLDMALENIKMVQENPDIITKSFPLVIRRDKIFFGIEKNAEHVRYEDYFIKRPAVCKLPYDCLCYCDVYNEDDEITCKPGKLYCQEVDVDLVMNKFTDEEMKNGFLFANDIGMSVSNDRNAVLIQEISKEMFAICASNEKCIDDITTIEVNPLEESLGQAPVFITGDFVQKNLGNKVRIGCLTEDEAFCQRYDFSVSEIPTLTNIPNTYQFSSFSLKDFSGDSFSLEAEEEIDIRVHLSLPYGSIFAENQTTERNYRPLGNMVYLDERNAIFQDSLSKNEIFTIKTTFEGKGLTAFIMWNSTNGFSSSYVVQ